MSIASSSLLDLASQAPSAMALHKKYIVGAHRAPLQLRTQAVGAVYDRPGFFGQSPYSPPLRGGEYSPPNASPSVSQAKVLSIPCRFTECEKGVASMNTRLQDQLREKDEAI